jgi:hypothetical protein
MRCKAPDTPQCEHCKWRATPQRARYGQQKCANYSCAGPKVSAKADMTPASQRMLTQEIIQ